MLRLVKIFFIVFLGYFAPSAAFPGFAQSTSGEEGGERGGGDFQQKKVVLINNVNVTNKDMQTIAQAFKDGKKVQMTTYDGGHYYLNEDVWDDFFPYDPELLRKELNSKNNYNDSSRKSIKARIKATKARLKNLDRKLEAAKKFGTKAQVKIIEKMRTPLVLGLHFMQNDLDRLK